MKLTLRDLPLHSVSNEDMLEALKEVCEVQSEVQYANVWFKGWLTNIRNGDHFVYVDLNNLLKFEEFFSVGEHRAHVFKPKMHSTCRHCGKDGHHASDMNCPARVPVEMSGTVEAFQGGKYELSNLHKCSHGCISKDGDKVFPLSEHYYQFHKLKAYDKIEDAFALLDKPEPFKVMRKSQELLPEDQVSDDWKASAVDEMRVVNTLKFCACDHARKALMKVNLMIARQPVTCFGEQVLALSRQGNVSQNSGLVRIKWVKSSWT